MVVTSIECTLPRPDIAELHQQVATELSKRLLGGAPVLPMSTEDVLSFVMAGTVNLMFGAVTQALKENNPATMCCDNLVAYGASHGINMRGATRAKGYAAITGIPNNPIPDTIRFVAEISREYKLDPGVTTNPKMLDATGAASLRIVSILSGSAYDMPPGTALIVSTTIPGIDMDALSVGNGMTGGTDDETCEQLRARIIAAESAGVIVVNEAWYLQQTMSYPGVTRACTDECEGCCDPQFMAIYPFMENGVYGTVTTPPYGVPPQEVLDEMTDWMFGEHPGQGEGLAPVGQRGAYVCAAPTYMNVVASCFSGCIEGTEDRVTNALWFHIRSNYCVGSKICKDIIRSVVYAAIGQDQCFGSITLQFDSTIGREDDAFAYLACGHFLVLGTVTINPVNSVTKR